jgi:pyruvate ferredoxin oxidoreductase gamma subunit
MKNMVEIRWHARAGQGAVTAAKLFAEAALSTNKHFQAFPEYGPERTGAPIQAFTRVSDVPITVHSNIENPDAVVVLDSTLLSTINVTEGLTDNGILLANTIMSPPEVKNICGIENRNYKVYTVDASKIAMETIGRDIPNTPMVGALLKAIDVISVDDVKDHLIKSFSKKFSQEIIDANVNAVERAYNEVRSG